MEKNYQIPLCKDCWNINYSKCNKDCIFFIKNGMAAPPYTKETASAGDPNKCNKEPLIDYKNNTCRFFETTEGRKEITRVSEWCKRDTERSNRRWFNSGKYYGQS